ncbi:hypothetical protein RJ640_008171 [Escallonia rubra]|uniref:J domain-containing protein n=1 Tax=Escallonia rubra TaxID=112253 RepID=A0AA88RYK3_9ASTE|nr:hypothetical protein RJ640_008171 [Escallonia rubra]
MTPSNPQIAVFHYLVIMSKNPQENLPLFASSSMDPQQPLSRALPTEKEQKKSKMIFIADPIRMVLPTSSSFSMTPHPFPPQQPENVGNNGKRKFSDHIDGDDNIDLVMRKWVKVLSLELALGQDHAFLDVGLTTKKQETPRDETRGIRWLRIFTTADYLKLYENPWKIKKTLETSGCNHLCRLMLSTKTVEKNILAFWDVETVKNVETPEGVRVKVWDYDSGTEHLLTFKKWASSRCFVFGNNWSRDFVRRRKLQQGDEIGLFWDASEKRFGFRVLDHQSRRCRPAQPPQPQQQQPQVQRPPVKLFGAGSVTKYDATMKQCQYKVLGLGGDCTAGEIRSAYHRLVLQRHPDKLAQFGISPAGFPSRPIKHFPSQPHRSKTGRTTNLASCIVATVFLLFLAAGIVVVYYFLLFKPKDPKIAVDVVQFPTFSVANGIVDFTFLQYVTVSNPNRDAFTHYDSSLQLAYSDAPHLDQQ